MSTPMPMNSILRCYALEARYQLLGLARMPAFALPTILFPAMFYVFFGLMFGGGSHRVNVPTYMMTTFATFGVIAPALFGFGVSVAGERGLGWLRLKRASPMPPGAYLAAKTITAMASALAVMTILFILGMLFGAVHMRPGAWLLLALTLLFGSLPFCALGLAIGLNVGTQAAPAVVNLIYMPLAFLSGLWVPLYLFPDWLQRLAPALPPYHLARLALHAAGQAPEVNWPVNLAALGAFTLVFTLVARRGWHRMKEE